MNVCIPLSPSLRFPFWITDAESQSQNFPKIANLTVFLCPIKVRSSLLLQSLQLKSLNFNPEVTITAIIRLSLSKDDWEQILQSVWVKVNFGFRLIKEQIQIQIHKDKRKIHKDKYEDEERQKELTGGRDLGETWDGASTDHLTEPPLHLHTAQIHRYTNKEIHKYTYIQI